MLKIFINNFAVFVPRNSSVLDACEKLGQPIPRFCFHSRLNIAGNCRMCLVEIEKSFFVLMAWENPVFLFPSLKPKFEAKFFTLQFSKKFSKDYFSQKYISPF